MVTIQLEVSEDIVAKMGKQGLIERLQRDLELEHLQLLAEKIHKATDEVGVDHEEIMKSARHKAWKTYKEKYLKDVLP